MSSTDSGRRFLVLVTGNWWEGFDDQGDNGNLWASSANPDNADNAMNANFNSGEVNPLNNDNRDNGNGVR